MGSTDTGLTGRVGDMIYYRMYGKTYVRAMPTRVRQTKATKTTATVFGRASTLGSQIRGQLKDILHDPTDHKMQIRLVSALFQWLQKGVEKTAELGKNLDMLIGFSFAGQGKKLSGRWKSDITVTNPTPGLVEIHIPAFVPDKMIGAPEGTVAVHIHIATGVTDLKNNEYLGGFSTELILPYDNAKVPERTISMAMPTPKNSLIVTGVSLKYMLDAGRYRRANQDKNFMPSAIVDVIYL